MFKTRKSDVIGNKIMVDANDLSDMLGCGRATAVRVAREANARVQIGKRVLYNVSKVKDYVDSISCD